MADLAEVFKTLKDDSSGAGESLVSRVEGEVGAGKAGAIGFAFKDSSGNVILPALTAAGKIPVDTESVAGTIIRDRATIVSGSVSVGSDNDVITLTLAVDQIYNCSDFMGATTRICKWTLVQNDNASETILDVFFTGPGQFSFSENPKNLTVTAGSTGVQQIILRANPLFSATDVHGRLSIIDLP